MELNEFIEKGGQKLRLGYTTGSCAAAAAKAAAMMLLNGKIVSRVRLRTPKGTELYLDIEDIRLHYGETRGRPGRKRIDFGKPAAPADWTGREVRMEPGDQLSRELFQGNEKPSAVSCAVRKDSGDDPDITNHILIYAKVSRSDTPGIRIDGGEGVGRVTKPGLNQPVGNAAINSTPRRMIEAAVREAAESASSEKGTAIREAAESASSEKGTAVREAAESISSERGTAVRETAESASSEKGTAVRGAAETALREERTAVREAAETAACGDVPSVCETENSGLCGDIPAGFDITIYVPRGQELAAKTFNPKLGIEGGISILGTSGIVEPMSDQALLDTIRVEISVRKEEGLSVLPAAPGNYGKNFFLEKYGFSLDTSVTTSNFIYDTVRMAAEAGFTRMLFVGHIGKLIKVAGGIRNTHSQYGDHRMEILTGITESIIGEAETGQTADLRSALAECVMTDEAVRILKEYRLDVPVLTEMTRRIKAVMEEWGRGKMKVEVVVFSNVHGELGRTENALEYMRILQEQLSG